MSEDPYHDLPAYELIQRAEKATEMGAIVFFKFTCENCGTRQGFDVPNTFYKEGVCEECGHVTEIRKGGFLLMFPGVIQ